MNGSPGAAAGAGPARHGGTVLMLSHVRYDGVFQRPQHVATRLAQRHRVLYVEAPLRVDGPPRLRRWQPEANVVVLQPQTPLSAPSFHPAQFPWLRELLAATFESLERPLLWLCTAAAWPLVSHLPARAVVYDRIDARGTSPQEPSPDDQESALLERADAVFVDGREVHRSLRTRHGRVLYLPSGVAADLYAAPDVYEDDPWEGCPHPRLGYFGAIDARIDARLVEQVARLRPDWHWMMVGPVTPEFDDSALQRLDNVHWFGQHAFASLPRMAAHCDVCVLPYVAGADAPGHTPAKMLEYMAAGRAIVSTAIAGVGHAYGPLVHVVEGPIEFVAACEGVLLETGAARASRASQMRDLAADHAWDQVVETMERVVDEPRPRRAREAHDVVVLGGGPTGLAFAQAFGAGVPVLEREAAPGGAWRSERIGPYLFDRIGLLVTPADGQVVAWHERLLGDALRRRTRLVRIGPEGHPDAPASPETFLYPARGGLQALVDALVAPVRAQVRTSAGVVAVDPRLRRLTLADGTRLDYERLVVTTPLPEFVRLAGDAVPRGVAEAARRLRWRSLRTVCVGVRRAHPTDAHAVLYPRGAAVFDRIFVQSNVSPDDGPADAAWFTCEVPYSAWQPLPLQGRGLVERAVADARRVGFLRADDAIECAVERDLPLAFVVHDDSRAGCVARIRNWLATLDVSLAGPWAEWHESAQTHPFATAPRLARALHAQDPAASRDARRVDVA